MNLYPLVKELIPFKNGLELYNATHQQVLVRISCSYHVPRSWLQSSSNILVLFEEMGGDPTQISLTTRETESICSQISETHPVPLNTWALDEETRKKIVPTLSLDCPFPNQIMSEIKFASFGTPSGTCGRFSHGECSSKRALSILQKVLLLTDAVNVRFSRFRFIVRYE